MSLDIINRVDDLVKKYFIYKSEAKDEWNSYAKEILEAEATKKYLRISDDCDGWAMTAIDLAAHYGVPLNKMGRVVCWADVGQNRPREGHMAAIYNDNGVYYYFGDTFGDPCNITRRNHNIVLINWLNDSKEWIEWK